MNLVFVVKYHDLFDDVRLDALQLLKTVPSSSVISIMAIINDTLMIKRNTVDTQFFILRNLCIPLKEKDRVRILAKARRRLEQGYKIFGYPYTVELINRELVNYKDDSINTLENDANATLKILKAYLSLVNEMMDKEFLLFNEAKRQLKSNVPFLQIMWPHLIKQHEFINPPDPIYESMRGFALMEFLENHPKYGVVAKSYFKSLSCNSSYEYLTRYLSIVIANLNRQDSPNPMDFFFKIKVSNEQPVLESLIIAPDEVRNDKSKQLDYRGMKERPLLKLPSNELIVPFWYFLYNALFNGIIFSFYKNSGIASLFEKKKADEKNESSGLGNFKAKIGKDFSESILFRNTMAKCFEREKETLIFFKDSDEFNPDCYYRKGNNVFIIEFKDNLLNSEVIQSNSYELIRNAIDTKFVESLNPRTGEFSEKGISQLARNIETLADKKSKFWEIDELAGKEGISLYGVKLYPIIVQTNIYFDVPGISEYLNEKLQTRLNPVKGHFKSIEPFTLLNFDYFFEKILLFSDSELHLEDEIDFYHITQNNLKEKGKVNLNDLLKSYSPFSFIDSPAYLAKRTYRKAELLDVLKNIWNINIPKDNLNEAIIA